MVNLHRNKYDVSIIIPARNEEHLIKKCLKAVFEQETDFSFDILVIDSGSVDKTIEMVKEFSSVNLMTISPDEFGHGKTRNLGAKITSGDYIVFLNADAVPANKKWLDSLIKGLVKDEKIAGIYSRHLPRENCYLYMIRDLNKSMSEKRKEKTRLNSLDFLLFSTVSAAVPRKVWETYPFDENVLIAEDQNWAKIVLGRQYKIIYEPDSMVVHSHNYTFRELFEIKKRVGQVLNGFNNRILNIFPGLIYILGGLVLKILADTVYIIFRKLSVKKKCRELKIALGSRIASFAGKYAGWIKS